MLHAAECMSAVAQKLLPGGMKPLHAAAAGSELVATAGGRLSGFIPVRLLAEGRFAESVCCCNVLLRYGLLSWHTVFSCGDPKSSPDGPPKEIWAVSNERGLAEDPAGCRHFVAYLADNAPASSPPEYLHGLLALAVYHMSYESIDYVMDSPPGSGGPEGDAFDGLGDIVYVVTIGAKLLKYAPLLRHCTAHAPAANMMLYMDDVRFVFGYCASLLRCKEPRDLIWMASLLYSIDRIYYHTVAVDDVVRAFYLTVGYVCDAVEPDGQISRNPLDCPVLGAEDAPSGDRLALCVHHLGSLVTSSEKCNSHERMRVWRVVRMYKSVSPPLYDMLCLALNINPLGGMTYYDGTPLPPAVSWRDSW